MASDAPLNEFISLSPLLLGFITLVVILAKMHADIETLKEKVKALFDLWNRKT